MAGQPRKQAMIAELIRRTSEEDEDITQLQYVENWIASGRTIVDLAEDMSKKTKLDISSQQIRRHLESAFEGARDSIARARLIGAHSMVETALQILDTAPTDSREKLQKAKMRADGRMWVAERWNAPELGQQKGVNIAISLPLLHLDAMRQRATAVASLSPESLSLSPITDEIILSDVEVIEE